MALLDPGYELNLRPMKYPRFYEAYELSLKDDWRVQEIDWSVDVAQLNSSKISDAERHLIKRLAGFWATGDTIVSNNVVLNLYTWINSPEARMFLSRQLFQESQHVQFYLTLVDTLIPNGLERIEAFQAVKNIPSVERKARFFLKWMDIAGPNDDFIPLEQRQAQFIRLLACVSLAVEGLFFFSSFCFAFYFGSRGLFPGIVTGTRWVFKEESSHIDFAVNVLKVIREESPRLFNQAFETDVRAMIREAVECEYQFTEDMLKYGVVGLSITDMRQYLEYIANQRLVSLGFPPEFIGARNPFPFMDLQDLPSFVSFFERRATEYQIGVTGTVSFDQEF